MPKLILKRKVEIIQTFILDIKEITFGQHPDNDIPIEDRSVSVEHCIIKYMNNMFVLEDMRSAFGTFVNGYRISQPVLLRDGDKIQLGNCDITIDFYLTHKEKEKYPDTDTNVDNDKTNTYDTPEEDAEKTDVLKIKGDSIKQPPKYKGSPLYLLAINGPYYGKRYQLKPDITRIGRNEEFNDIVLDKDKSVSRRHATITYKEDGKYYLTDKRSKSRTYLNKTKLIEDTDLALTIGDEIEIASAKSLQSTIFRLVEEGEWDFSSPKRAGVTLLKIKEPVILIGVILIVLMSIFSITNDIGKIIIINQKPSSLQLSGGVIEDWEAISQIGLKTMLTSLATTDLNNDKKPDLIYVRDKIYALSAGTNNELWKVDLTGLVNSSPALADINGDKIKDIAITTNDSRVFIIDGASGMTQRSDFIGGTISSTPTLSDLNGDGTIDIVAYSEEGQLLVGYSNPTGTEITWKENKIISDARFFSSPTTIDLNNDGIKEILIGGSNGIIYIWDGKTLMQKGTIDINEQLSKARGRSYEMHPLGNAITVGDLNNDGYYDLIVTTRNNSIAAFDGKDDRFLLMWEYEERLAIQPPIHHSSASLVDLNLDGKLDVIFHSINGTIYAFNGEGERSGKAKILWEYNTENKKMLLTTPVLADLNKDGIPDVISGDSDGKLYILDGNPSNSNRLLWKSENLGSSVTGSPIVADIDGDTYLEIALTLVNRQLVIFKTNSRVLKNTIIWSMLYYNPLHTGIFYYTPLSVGNNWLTIIFAFIILIISIGCTIIRTIQRRQLIGDDGSNTPSSVNERIRRLGKRSEGKR